MVRILWGEKHAGLGILKAAAPFAPRDQSFTCLRPSLHSLSWDEGTEPGGIWESPERGVPQHPSPSWMHPTIPALLGPFLRRVGPRAGLGRRPSASRRRRRRGGERPCRSFARCGKGEKGGRLSHCFPKLRGIPLPGPQPGQEWPGCHHSPQLNGTTLG